MGLTIRKALAADAPAWLELLRLATENEYPDKQAYDSDFIAAQLQEAGAETWIAEDAGVIYATLTFLPPGSESTNPVANIGRHLQRPEAYENGAATALIEKAVEEAQSRKQLLISRVPASDLQQQHLYEAAGFAPVGFQPHKHAHKGRESVIFYYRLGGVDVAA